MADLADLGALEARDRLARGEISAVALTESLLARIAAREPAVAAFAFIDADKARRAAAAADAWRASGQPLPPLHGLAVGVKDVIDTADMPTGNGTPLDAGRRPAADAEAVRRLRAAGAIVIGKTVTTELEALHPSRTKNPHDPSRTPGGSSSGSAAAVAAGMIPLALGTQTVGSVIRPSSFCGVVGYKPTFGLISRAGVLPQAASLDTVGVMARSVADAALVAGVLAGHDPADPDSVALPVPALLAAALAEPPSMPRLAFVKGPTWEKATPDTQAGFAHLAAALGDVVREETLSAEFAAAPAAAFTISRVGIARNYRPYLERGRDQLSAFMQGAIEEGSRITAVDFLAARELQETLYARLVPIFDRYDAIVTPAAPGEAPGPETTGDAAFNGIWTLCQVPAITLPLLKGAAGLPIGVQVVSRRGDDARLLRTARWLMETAAAKKV